MVFPRVFTGDAGGDALTITPADICAAVLRLPFAAPRDLARAHEAAIADAIHASHGVPACARRLDSMPSRETVRRFLWALSEMDREASTMEIGQAMQMTRTNAREFLSRLHLHGLVTRRDGPNNKHLWSVSFAGRVWLKREGAA